MNPRIMIVEDEPPLVELLSYNLRKEGFDTFSALDGEEAMTLVEECQPDIILLDWMLPELSGIEVCRQLRRRQTTKHLPIIMLTAKGEEGDRIRGLDTGADDYITKPFSPREVIARLRAVLRRSNPSFDSEALQYRDINMDLAAHKVSRGLRALKLGPTEFRLLRCFMEQPGRVFSREQLLDKVWGYDAAIEPRTVDVHIRRLRKALNGPDELDLIRTVRSAGYALDEDV
ncbi:MAG: phosphate regulon transcriptional regulator PhoB [Rhodospirillales bacterium]